MTDELGDELERLPRRSAPSELRGRVLSAVNRELAMSPHRVPRWERAFELAATACLIAGVSVTAWQWRAEQAWHQRVFGPQLAKQVSPDCDAALAATDPQLAQLVRQRMIARPTRLDDWQHWSRQQTQLLRDIAANHGG